MKTIFYVVFIFVVLVIAIAFLNTIIWAWVVPDVFSGMVAAGLLPATITFSQSVKLTFLGTSLFGLGRFNGRSKND